MLCPHLQQITWCAMHPFSFYLHYCSVWWKWALRFLHLIFLFNINVLLRQCLVQTQLECVLQVNLSVKYNGDKPLRFLVQSYTRSTNILVRTHRLVAQSDDVRHRAGATVLHDNPQVSVLEVAAIVFHYIRTKGKCKTEWLSKEK